MTSASSREFRRHCRVLGLLHVDSMSALNAAYRPLISAWHPDRHHGSEREPLAASRAGEINAAYAYLSAAIASRNARVQERPASTQSPGHDGFPDESVLEIFIKSSSISSVGYNSTTRVLYLRFVGGRTYRYQGVPSGVLEEMLSAPSRGAYANAHIIYRYPYEPC